MEVSCNFKDYELIDASNGEKYERISESDRGTCLFFHRYSCNTGRSGFVDSFDQKTDGASERRAKTII